MHSCNGFNRSRTTLSGNRVETGGTHGDHFDRGSGLHGGNGVTGVDRALEGVGAFHRNDLGDLVNVQLRSNPWQDVFAVGGGGSQDMAVASAKLCNQRRYVFRQLMRVSGVVGQQYFAHTGDFCRGFSHGASALTCYQYVDVTTDFGGSGHSVQGGRGQHFVVVFCDYQDSHC
ncbi:hypothetical protein PSGE105469_22105 [Pseudomonas gessardii]